MSRSASTLNQPRVKEWIAWTKAASKTCPEYLPKALLAVLLNDGPRVLAAVLSELGMDKSLSLIEGMREHGTEVIPRKDAEDLPGKDSLEAIS